MRTLIIAILLIPVILYSQTNESIVNDSSTIKRIYRNPCNVNAASISPRGVKYSGGCVNGMAQGPGVLTFNSGDVLKGTFNNNMLQDGIIEYEFASKPGLLLIGPMQNGAFNGRFISLDLNTGFVSVANYVNRNHVGNSDDYFNIPEPTIFGQEIFPIYQEFKESIKYPIHYICGNSYDIPYTTQKLFTVHQKQNINSDYSQMYLSLYDSKTNKIIRQFGSYKNPIEKFICFAPDYKSFYVSQKQLKISKVYNIDLSNGVQRLISKEEEQYLSILKSNISNNHNILFKSNLVNNNKKYQISKYSITGALINQIQLGEEYYGLYSTNEFINEIAFANQTSDSVYVSLYTLDSLKFIKNIPLLNPKYPIQKLGFSPSGKFMYLALTNPRSPSVHSFMGTFIFKDDKLYFGIPNAGILAFNDYENMVLSEDLLAYDLENKKTLWTAKNKITGVTVKNVFKIDNDLILQTQENGGVGKSKPLLSRINIDYPQNSKTFFSLNMKVQEEIKATENAVYASTTKNKSELIEGKENNLSSSSKTELSNSNESYISKMARAYAELLSLAKNYGVTIDTKPFGGSKSGNTKPNNNSGKSSSKKCDYCGNHISADGYSIKGDKIIEGKYDDPLLAQISYNQFGGKGKMDNTGNYCTRKCAVEAYKSGARR
jgi:hypothetical protein